MLTRKAINIMENIGEAKNEIAIVDKETVENLIYIVRGQKVMLDIDLAKIYGYSTKAFILLNDFTCREIILHNAVRFNRMIALGSIQRYAV